MMMTNMVGGFSVRVDCRERQKMTAQTKRRRDLSNDGKRQRQRQKYHAVVDSSMFPLTTGRVYKDIIEWVMCTLQT